MTQDERALLMELATAMETVLEALERNKVNPRALNPNQIKPLLARLKVAIQAVKDNR